MCADERAIRDLIATWLRVSAAGDAAPLRDLMAEDIVFLLPGQPPMRGRDHFLALQGTMLKQMKIDATADIQEIEVSGNLAYCWNHLTVAITPVAGGESKRRTGHVLTVFRKEPDGRWVFYRDANLLTEAK